MPLHLQSRGAQPLAKLGGTDPVVRIVRVWDAGSKASRWCIKGRFFAKGCKNKAQARLSEFEKLPNLVGPVTVRKR